MRFAYAAGEPDPGSPAERHGAGSGGDGLVQHRSRHREKCGALISWANRRAEARRSEVRPTKPALWGGLQPAADFSPPSVLRRRSLSVSLFLQVLQPAYRLAGAEFVDRCCVVRLAGLQLRTWELGLVGRIGEVLGLHAEGGAERVGDTSFAFHASVEKIAGVELQSRLGGPHFHHAAALRLADFGSLRQRPAGAVQHEIVIVAVAELELLVIVLNAGRSEEHTSELQ